ncbi:MAG TPA: protein kinase [Pseudonocardiaceae bacterium]|nr:protein kinase [Pseudonocardiaceae bacterium]
MTGWSVPGMVHLRGLREDSVGQRVLARRRLSRQSRAITYLSPELLADTDFRARFGAECAKLARVRDARLARVHRYVECDAQGARGAAVISDYIRGTTLRSLLLAQGALGTEAALVVLTDVLRALTACHDAGVAHGDVKPEHVVLTPAGQVRLVDPALWGSAGRRQLAGSTPFYLAPELWSDPLASGAGGDVYAATTTFFECLVGAPPFYSTEVAELAAKHLAADPPLEVVPEPVRELVARGLAKDPRPRTDARDFAAFAGVLASRAVRPGWESRGRQELAALLSAPGQRGGRADRASRAGYRKPVRLAAVMGGALALAVGLSSPPLVVITSSSIFGPDSKSKPPVLAFPEPEHGRAAMRVVTKSEHGFASAAKVRRAAPVTGTPRPASPVTGTASDIAPSEHIVHDERYQDGVHPDSAGPGQPALTTPPACTQRLASDHKPCVMMNPERPDPAEASFPVSFPIPLFPLVQHPAPLPEPLRPSWSKDVHPRSPGRPERAEQWPDWSQKGIAAAKDTADPGNG